MLGAMTRTPETWTANLRGAPFGTEVVVLWLACFADAAISQWHPVDGPFGIRLVSSLAIAVGVGIPIVALLRRKFGRLLLLTLLTSASSLLITVLVVQTRAAEGREIAPPSIAEVVGLALLVGALCRRSAPLQIIPFAALALVAMTLSPLLRLGVDSERALLAVPAAVVWGASVAVGLVLRDADNLRRDTRQATREAERLSLARELHDVVAHHITGIVVLAQGAQRVEGSAVLAQIEQAGSEALTATRELVGMLRTETHASLDDALKDACGNDRRVRLSIGEGVAVRPELITTAHRIVLEAVTNARRHGAAEGLIEVTARTAQEMLTLEIVNPLSDAGAEEGTGYGLLGMSERLRLLGGTLTAGRDDGFWRVTATLPLNRAWI
jgi:signal transduction histidine kinase